MFFLSNKNCSAICKSDKITSVHVSYWQQQELLYFFVWVVYRLKLTYYTCTCSKLLNKGKLTVCWSTVYHKLKKTNMIDTCDDLIRLLTPLFVVFLSGLCSLSFQAMKPVLRYILWKRRFLLFIYMCTLYLLVHVCGLKIDLTCSCLLKYSV